MVFDRLPCAPVAPNTVMILAIPFVGLVLVGSGFRVKMLNT
jgi:hypothetical protein